ncbi:unnamed protein product [Cochlearia groenlandica]
MPPIFERECRARESKLRSWLEDMPQLSYEASDFDLPANLEVDSLLEFSEFDDGANGTQGGADEDRVDGEVAEDADLAEGSETARRDE